MKIHNLQAVMAFFALVMTMSFSGCAEFDDAPDGRYDCACQQALHNNLNDEGEMGFIKTTDDENCEALIDALTGEWNGIDDFSDRRFHMNRDGHYTIEIHEHNRWRQADSGEFWIEYELHRGMMRPELHMKISSMDDYSVRYHIDGDILYLEESSEIPMRFKLQK